MILPHLSGFYLLHGLRSHGTIRHNAQTDYSLAFSVARRQWLEDQIATAGVQVEMQFNLLADERKARRGREVSNGFNYPVLQSRPGKPRIVHVPCPRRTRGGGLMPASSSITCFDVSSKCLKIKIRFLPNNYTGFECFKFRSNSSRRCACPSNPQTSYPILFDTLRFKEASLICAISCGVPPLPVFRTRRFEELSRVRWRRRGLNATPKKPG